MEKQFNKFYIIILLLFLISGCKKNNTSNKNKSTKEDIIINQEDEKIPTKEEVEIYIYNKYGKDNIVNYLNNINNENIYIVHSPLGFDYYLYTGLTLSNNYYKKYYKDTFYKELIKKEKTNIDSIFNKYSEIKTDYKIIDNALYFNIELNNNKYTNIVCDFLYDIKNLLELFNIRNCDDINVTITNKYTNISYNKIIFSDLNEYERKDYLKILDENLIKKE